MPSIFKEYNLTTNEYNRPDEYVGKKAIGLLVVRLLLLEPGTDPMRPEMGIGLPTIFRYLLPERLPDLKKEIATQLAIYLPQYQAVQVDLSLENNQLFVKISVDDDIYKYVLEEQKDKDTVSLTELFNE